MLTTIVENDPFPTMTFTNEDRKNVVVSHDDALVVEMKIANMRVRIVLIDTGSSVDIIHSTI